MLPSFYISARFSICVHAALAVTSLWCTRGKNEEEKLGDMSSLSDSHL